MPSSNMCSNSDMAKWSFGGGNRRRRLKAESPVGSVRWITIALREKSWVILSQTAGTIAKVLSVWLLGRRLSLPMCYFVEKRVRSRG